MNQRLSFRSLWQRPAITFRGFCERQRCVIKKRLSGDVVNRESGRRGVVPAGVLASGGATIRRGTAGRSPRVRSECSSLHVIGPVLERIRQLDLIAIVRIIWEYEWFCRVRLWFSSRLTLQTRKVRFQCIIVSTKILLIALVCTKLQNIAYKYIKTFLRCHVNVY